MDFCLSCNSAAFDKVMIANTDRYAMVIPHTVFADDDDITVIANSDIIIPLGSLTMIESSLGNNQVYCLSRWDISAEGIKLFDHADSQDSWVFRGPVRLGVSADYCFGMPGCDNRFAHELAAADYELLNPSRDIITYHFHLCRQRPNNIAANRVPGPYMFIDPAHLGETPKYIKRARVSTRASRTA
jgi:hypothetical protein